MKKLIAFLIWMAAMYAAAKAGTGVETTIAVLACTVYSHLPRKYSWKAKTGTEWINTSFRTALLYRLCGGQIKFGRI